MTATGVSGRAISRYFVVGCLVGELCKLDWGHSLRIAVFQRGSEMLDVYDELIEHVCITS